MMIWRGAQVIRKTRIRTLIMRGVPLKAHPVEDLLSLFLNQFSLMGWKRSDPFAPSAGSDYRLSSIWTTLRWYQIAVQLKSQIHQAGISRSS